MKQPQLISFEIIKFNGDQNIKITFQENRKVLIAENGSGKTTILNILYFCLTDNLEKLKEYDFQECILIFNYNKKLSIKHTDLQKNDGESRNLLTREIHDIDDRKVIRFLNAINMIAEDIFEKNGRISFERFIVHYFQLINNYQNIFPKEKILDDLISYIERDLNNIISPRIFNCLDILSLISSKDLEDVYLVLQEDDFERKFMRNVEPIGFYERRHIFNKEIYFILLGHLRFFGIRNNQNRLSTKELLKELKIIFLPTYRRIENKLEDLFSSNNILRENSNINFGLEDVLSLFKMIKKNVEDRITEQLAELNNNIISDMINHKTVVSRAKIEKLKNEEYISDVLNILKKNISRKDKNSLILKLKNLNLDNRNHNTDYLFLYLDKLSNIYENREIISQEIIKFIDVCNKYLKNKYFDFDKSNLEIEIKLKKDKKPINLSSLSSGEKQIISLFAKLYIHHLSNPDLNKKQQYWIIFDEPELSLSIEWQRMLLEDIWNSGRCGFIFATTHSPFIFDNEFKFYTSHIKECLSEQDYG